MLAREANRRAGLLIASAAALALAGCAGPAQGAASSPPPIAGQRGTLAEIPAMQQGWEARDRGSRQLELAYGSRSRERQERAFQRAHEAFQEASAAFHAALIEAPERYHPVIEEEIETVAHYLRQIQRDRPPGGAG